jgi:adhesin/invasin
VPVVSAGPGLFFDGSGRAVVQNTDYSLNTVSNPAKAGSTIMAYLTGSGPVSAAVPDGADAPSDPLVRSTAPVTAKIGSASAEVSFAGLAPGFVGLAQVNIVIPSGLAKGDYPLTVTIDGQTSNAATISVTP